MPKRRNSKARTRRRGGSGSGGGWKQPRASLSRFTNMQSHVFRLSQQQGVASDGSGNVAGYSYNDPTSTLGNFTEHINYLANLFTEYRAVRSVWHLVPQLPFNASDVKLTDNPVLAVGLFTRNPSSLPTLTSLNQVLDNQPSKLWAVCSDTSGRGLTMSGRFNNVLYQLVTTTSTDYAGAPGGLAYYGSGFPASITIFTIHIQVWLQYRARS